MRFKAHFSVGQALQGGYPLAEKQIPRLRPRVGEVQIRCGGPSAGKSSDAYTLVPALAGQGRVMFGYTSGNADDYASGMHLHRFGPFRNDDGNVHLVPCTTTVKYLALSVYKMIVTACVVGVAPPLAAVIDDVDQLVFASTGPGDPRHPEAVARFLRALACLDLLTIGEMAGTAWEDYSGETVPPLPGLGLAVVAYTTTRDDLPDADFGTDADVVVRLRHLRPYAGDPEQTTPNASMTVWSRHDPDVSPVVGMVLGKLAYRQRPTWSDLHG
jgi:hypothetical protein